MINIKDNGVEFIYPKEIYNEMLKLTELAGIPKEEAHQMIRKANIFADLVVLHDAIRKELNSTELAMEVWTDAAETALKGELKK